MAVDFILKIEGVRGESKKKEEEPPIEIDAFSYELSSHSGALQTRTRGRRYTDITFKKRLDKSSIAIQQMLIQNAKINKVTFTARKTGGKELLKYYTITLSDAYITSYKVSGGDNEDDDELGDIPRDEFTVNFRKVEVEYDPQNEKGLGSGKASFADEINANA